MRSGGSSRSKTSIRRAKSRMPHIKAPRAHNKTRARFMPPCPPVTDIELKQLWPETVPGGLAMVLPVKNALDQFFYLPELGKSTRAALIAREAKQKVEEPL